MPMTFGTLGARTVRPTFKRAEENGWKTQFRCRTDFMLFVRNVTGRWKQRREAPVEDSSTAPEAAAFHRKLP